MTMTQPKNKKMECSSNPIALTLLSQSSEEGDYKTSIIPGINSSEACSTIGVSEFIEIQAVFSSQLTQPDEEDS